jgi:hypothetical protein
MDFLEPIILYKMDEKQSLAYKIGLLWLVLSRKKFPEYIHTKTYPKKGDPRKCSLFKYCYKLVKETQGLIPDDEYKLYIKAQLDILRAINQGDVLVEPVCLSGDKAWVRWKLWKKKFDKLNQSTTASAAGVAQDPIHEIIINLKRTRAFLEGKFGNYGEEQIMMAVRDMKRWLVLGKITPYYALLSPWAKKHLKDPGVDLGLYRVTVEVEVEFKKIFANEFA